jgi:tRNA nucleotidyltransferase/poly(A) polymerase
VAEHVYVVGGAVRNFILGVPIKDIDVVVDSVALGGRKNSEWFAQQVARAIPTRTSLTTNQYGVAILTVSGSWVLDGENLEGEVIEIANARKESYTGGKGKGKGYKPTDVQPATIEEDVFRREFTFNALLWRLLDLTDGPEKAEVIDLTGCGLRDLSEREMRCPRNPDIVFADDPTRQLRALKFALKYDFRIPPDLAVSIRRNAGKLRDMPWEAVATILVRDILDTPKAREALVMMKKLGLIDVLAEMIRDEKPFAAFMAGQMTQDKDVQLLLDLADLGLGNRAVSFLSPDQQRRLREVTVAKSSEVSTAYLAALKQPPIDNLALIEEFSIPPKDRGILAVTARRIILERPELAHQTHLLNEVVREVLAEIYE